MNSQPQNKPRDIPVRIENWGRDKSALEYPSFEAARQAGFQVFDSEAEGAD